jgi:hypothetical protein
MEAVWNILKQKIRKLEKKDKEDMTDNILQAWAEISLEEV